MIATLDTLLVRHRRGILVYGLVLGVALMVLAALGVPGIGIGLLVTVAVLVTAAVAVEGNDRSDMMAISPRAFGTPLAGTPVVGALAHIALVAACFALGVREAGVRAPWLTLLAALAAPALRFGYGAWHGRGVTVTPDGLRVAKMSGSVVVAWQALAAEQPAQDPDAATNGTIVLAYARPELVTTTGWPVSADRIGFSRTGRDFLAATIRYYLAHPEDRRVIGTAAGYRRLHKNIGREPDVPRPAVPPRTVRWIVRTAVGGVLLTVAAVAVYAWTETRLDGHGLLEELTRPLLFAMFAGIGMVITALASAYRRSHPRPGYLPEQGPPRPVRPDWAKDVTNG